MPMTELAGAALTLRTLSDPLRRLHAELETSSVWAGAPAALPTRTGLALDAHGLSKSYGTRRVLESIDLQIAPGEFVAIVGRSRCGKSTLLRLLAGLESASAGRITLGLPGPDSRRRAREALAQVGLADRADDWPAVLSGGQRQRVALARALVHRPRLLLLDEPLGALDALTRIEMQQLIETLWREHGFTALLVTHDVSEAVALADRVVLIDDHRIALDERIALPRPRSRGQAAFAALEDRVLRQVLRSPGHDAPAAEPIALPLPLSRWRWAV